MKVDSGSRLKSGLLSTCPWYPAVTFLVAASPEEHRNIGPFWKCFHALFLRASCIRQSLVWCMCVARGVHTYWILQYFYVPLASGSHLVVSVCRSRSAQILDFTVFRHAPRFRQSLVRCLHRPRCTGILLGGGDDFSIACSACLLDSGYTRARQKSEFLRNFTHILREGRPRILRSILVLALPEEFRVGFYWETTSGKCLRILSALCLVRHGTQVCAIAHGAFRRGSLIFYVKVDPDPHGVHTWKSGYDTSPVYLTAFVRCLA